MDQTTAELRKSILNTAERHPNSKVSKLINCFEVERTPQNIALLLMELAEHSEYSADISLSLKYYLDYFKQLTQECSFADAGIVLYNSSKIYAKRVDHIHQEVERLILSLSNVENTNENNINADAENKANAPKEKRGRKRPLEPVNGPYEVEMSTKRFKKMANNKRFEDSLSKRNNNMHSTFQESRLKDAANTIKHYIHPATWQHSIIEDFDYEDEVDSKKNYKLFTYHLEHRYNTLIADINFKMYFKMKDYIDGECRDSALPESWPPLSDAYIEQYVNMEDVILTKEGHYERSRILSEETAAIRSKENDVSSRNTRAESIEPSFERNTSIGHSIADSGIESDITDTQIQSNISENEITNPVNFGISFSETNTLVGDLTKNSDSGVGLDISAEVQLADETMTTNEPAVSSENQIQTNTEAIQVIENCSIMDEEMTENLIGAISSELENQTHTKAVEVTAEETTTNVPAPSSELEIQTTKDASGVTEKDPTLLENSKQLDEDLSTLKIRLPHLADEGIFFSELDEVDRQMLSPAVVAQDVFPGIVDKSNIVIAVDDAIKQLFQIREPSDEMLSLPLHAREEFLLPLNILEIPLKYFKKRSRFKLGPEFNLPKKERLKKYVRRYEKTTSSIVPRKSVRLSEDVTGVPTSPSATPSYEPEWLGFPEEEVAFDKNRTMSRDSGISLQQIDREPIEEFGEASDLLHSTLKLPAFGSESNLVTENLESNLDLSEGLSGNVEKRSQNNEEPTTVASDECLNNNAEATTTASDDCRQNNEEATTSASDDCGNNDKDSTAPFDDCRENNDEAIIASDDCQRNQLDDLNEETRVRTKVQEWHSHLQPILACSRERHHFDVFALGTEIMSQFDRTDVCYDKVSLKDVMGEKDESLISRYFLSMLLLANQGNISIDVQNKSTNEPSELHDIRLKLVSRKRNIVSLEDNIGLAATQTASTRIVAVPAPAVTKVRTLKRFPEVPKMDDRDSGIAMSEDSIA